MKKIVVKYKLIFLYILLAVAILVPTQSFLVEAKAVIEPIISSTSRTTLNESSGDIDDIEGDLDGGGAEEGESGGSASSSVPFKGRIITTSVISDENLYEALLDVYKEKTGTSYSNIYSDMFADFDVIDISADRTDAKNYGVTSLSGMGELDLKSLTTFKADLNQIEVFDETCFQGTKSTNFKTLSLAGNKISEFKITKLTGLFDINLSGNKLTTLDLSAIEAKSVDTPFSLNVAGNNFASMDSIILPTKRIGHITLNIINNNIPNIASEYFTAKYTISAGIQGFASLDGEFFTDSKDNVTVYRTNSPNLRIDVYKTDGAEDILQTSIMDQDFEDDEYFKSLNLPVGQYEYYYMFVDANGEEDAQDEYDSTRMYFNSNKFKVIPQKPTYLFIHKGKEYKTLNKVTGAVTVKLTGEEGATLMYQINNGEWKTGDTIECCNGGTYSIKLKSIVNDMESEVSTILVRTSLNLYVPDGVMLVFVLLIALVLFLVIIPIISKKYFKKD